MSPGEGMRDLCAIFGRALDETPARRAALIAAACGRRTLLQRRIARLLVLAASHRGFLDRPPHSCARVSDCFESRYRRGDRVGACRLLRRLGSGGTAEVWLAAHRNRGLEQRVAVKIARAPNRRFAIESAILGSLTHPGIARLYEAGVDAGAAYMIMEYIEGEHLLAYCNAGQLGLAQRLAAFLQICDAVSHAHAHRVVHGDLKPANILVARDGTVKLVDFGVATVLGDGGAQDLARPLRMSPAYAAPEQLAGDAAGTASDVHALGVILFELLTGALPWAGGTSSLTHAVQRLLVVEAPRPSRAVTAASPVAASEIGGDLDAIVGRALRRDASARHADASALADDVRRHLDRRQALTRRALRRAAPSPSPSRARRCVR